MVFSFHTEDPISPTDMKQHEFRGARTILLLEKMDRRKVDESGWTEYIMTARNVRNNKNLKVFRYSFFGTIPHF